MAYPIPGDLFPDAALFPLTDQEIPMTLLALGAATATVTVGSALDLTGAAGTIEGLTITPECRLVWAATGDAFEVWATSGASSLTILADQAGVVASGTVNGAAAMVEVRGWTLLATWWAVKGTQRVRQTRRFTVPASGATIDLDLLPVEGALPPMVVTYGQTLYVAADSVPQVTAARDAAAASALAASGSASAASGSASAASGSAGTATTKAGEAATSAANALTSENNAAATLAASALKASNLSDLASATTARTNLGLGNSATRAVGTTAGTVAAGDDARLSDARTPTAHTQAASTISDSTTAGRSLLTAADATAQRTALGLGTAATTAAAAYATAAQGTTADGAIPKSTATTKGDLLAATASATITRLAVGTNGAALLADSAQATGLRWSTVLRFSGTGSPEGVVTAPVGSEYTDTANTCGALKWSKATGTGNTGWAVTAGDTGWRSLASLIVNGWGNALGYGLRIRRIDNLVTVEGRMDGTSATSDVMVATLPAGFTFSSYTTASIGGLVTNLAATTVGRLLLRANGGIELNQRTANWSILTSWATADAWPNPLPGV